MALAFLSLLGATLFALAIPRLLGTAIDEALASGLRSQLLLLAGTIILVSLLRGICSYGQTHLAEAISQRVAYDLRNAFFEKLQRLSFGFHDRQHTGNLMSKATADVEATRWFVSMGLVRGLSLLTMILGVSVVLLTLNWPLGLVSLALVPPVSWRSIVMARRQRRTWTRVQEETGHMTTVLQENLAGMRVVKAFAAEEHEKGKFNARATAVAQHTLSAEIQHGSNSAFMTFIFLVATGAILWFGGREVILGRLSPGELAQFLFYMGLLTQPVRMIGWMVNTFTRAASAGQRLFEVLDTESPVKERPGARELPRVHGLVHFKDVSFSYDSWVPAIRHINLEAQPGQLVALLGAPGSGKSTIVHLLPRFYDVSSGQVTVDGVDIKDMTLASLRRNVGIVLQDVFLFSATIKENIAYGATDATMEDIIQASKVAQLHAFIEGLPEGYDTWVGERGVTLSGGQRQRLAIARTLLIDPPVLILDDSTSSVDMGTEHLIQQALAQVIKGRTTFVIAHRLSSVHNADFIVVLDQERS